ncbi:MAG TPA: DUF5652 family protein [Candidatus Paceibacterota bacterium]|jgi:hypothetical protein|nr:DUF5652 family protein [Candidatus Paceibacterota bacterium]
MYHTIFLLKVIGAAVIVWTIFWKIYAVWLSARHDRKQWFVVLILVNTLSILEMIYVFKIEKKTWEEVKADFHKGWQILKHTKKEDFKSRK